MDFLQVSMIANRLRSKKEKGMYKYPRRFSRKYCKRTLCKDMGFTQKA